MKKKTKMATGLLAGFACVALVSVGFSGWVISNQSEQSAVGNVLVYTVTDNSVSLSAQTSDKLIFGGTGTTIEDAWLTFDEADGTENLSVVVSITASRNIGDVSVKFDAGLDEDGTISASDDFLTATQRNYITFPSCTAYADSACTSESDIVTVNGTGPWAISGLGSADGSATETTNVYLKFTFEWGSHFGNKNPYEYYNGMAYDATILNGYSSADGSGCVTESVSANVDAAVSLADLSRLVGGLTYRFTCDGTAAV